MRKVIVITGANRGIGLACARLFLDKAYNVALLGRNYDELVEISLGYANALPICCDVTKDRNIKNAFNEVLDKWGRLDVLFNNAGISFPETRIDKVTSRDWRKIINVNLTGAFICAREAFRIMVNQVPQGGRIINNGSISAKVPRLGTVAYTSSKHAITGLTKAIALDGRNLNIVCSQIDIGNANTAMVQKINKNIASQKTISPAPKKEEPTMDVVHVANSVLHIAELPLDANIQYMTILANKMPFIGRG